MNNNTKRKYYGEYVFKTEFVVLDENDCSDAWFDSYEEAKEYIKDEVKSGRDECLGLIKVRSMSELTGWGGADLVRTTVLKKFF